MAEGGGARKQAGFRESTTGSVPTGPDYIGWAVALAIAAMVLAFVWGLRHDAWNLMETMLGRRPLSAATSWHYQLDRIDAREIARRTADVLVVDFAKEKGRVPLTPEEVEHLKHRPDGSKRLVIAYLSVGEAEQFRSYFQDEWKSSPPSWLGPENCAWPEAHKVRYWEEGWKDIVYQGPASYLMRIIAAGFDGVYLDRVDMYDIMRGENPNARADMIAFVTDLARTARTLKPGFLVIPQNAEELLRDRAYRQVIDGLGKEDLLHGMKGTGRRNTAAEINGSLLFLKMLTWERKPVLAVEYLIDEGSITRTRQEMLGHGLVPTFAPRSLDGSDPTRPALPLEKDIGTAEYTARNCPPGTSW